MNVVNLRTYIEDHLAGSVGALELLSDLIEAGIEVAELRAEIQRDQDLLKDVLHRLDATESTVKQAGAWMAQKVMRTKLRPGDALGLLEALEMLSLGIEGKLRLWKALAELDLGVDGARLEKSAADQIRKVEALRMEAARQAFL